MSTPDTSLRALVRFARGMAGFHRMEARRDDLGPFIDLDPDEHTESAVLHEATAAALERLIELEGDNGRA